MASGSSSNTDNDIDMDRLLKTTSELNLSKQHVDTEVHANGGIDKVQFYDRSVRGHLSHVTRLIREVRQLMNNCPNVKLVSDKLNKLDYQFEKYSTAFQLYYDNITSLEDRKKAKQRFDTAFNDKIELDIYAGNWIDTTRLDDNGSGNMFKHASPSNPITTDDAFHPAEPNSNISYLTPKAKAEMRSFKFDDELPSTSQRTNFNVNSTSQINSTTDTIFHGFERIYNQQQKTMEIIASTLNTSLETPRPNLLSFDSNPLNYWRFINNFDSTIDVKIKDDNTKLTHLIELCIGEAREDIEGCGALPAKSGYKEARRILHKNYGRPHVIARAHIGNLVNGSKLKNNDRVELKKLARAMNNCHLTLNSMGYNADLNASDNLLKIMLRLPLALQHQYSNVADAIIEKGTEPTFKNLLDFIQTCARVSSNMYGEAIGTQSSESKQTDSSKYYRRRDRDLNATTMFTESSPNINHKQNVDSIVLKCVYCNGHHCLDVCTHFVSMTIKTRVKFCREQRLCDNCLQHGHIARGCMKGRKCNNCNKKHHTLLHSVSKTQTPGNHSNTTPNDAICNAVKSGKQVRLKVVPVSVMSNGNVAETYALLDSGADLSLCHIDLVNSLGLKGTDVNVSLVTLNGSLKTSSKVYDVKVKSLDGHNSINISELVAVDNLPITSGTIPTNEDCRPFLHLRNIKLPSIDTKSVKLLIGADIPEAHWHLEDRKGNPGEPYAVKTPLGWTLMGPSSNINASNSTCVNFISTENCINDQIKLLWSTEFNETSHPIKTLSKEDQTAQKIMDESINLTNGHYYLNLPWRQRLDVPNNKWLAESRLNSLKRRLLNDPDLLTKYAAVINSYIDNNFAKRIPLYELAPKHHIWYLPHHPVINSKKPDKVRVVYDCSAKFRNVSLNDMLFQGPDLTNSLVGVLLRFRENRAAFIADIEAMYHQVRVKDSDIDMLRFLWWPDNNLTKAPAEYRMLVHIFGATSSPSCASYALRKTADDNASKFGMDVGNTVKRNFYVDDCLKSCPTVKDAESLIGQLCNLLTLGGFNLTKFACNFPQDNLPQDKLAKVNTVNLKSEHVTHTLGVQWNISCDAFQFNVTKPNKPATRRGILSVISGVYDPLGFVAPFILPAKQILQSLCLQKFDWDVQIPIEHERRWFNWINDLPCLEGLRIPRCFTPQSTPKDVQMHHFCDASSTGYGAVVYLRVEDQRGEISCHFVMGKSRLHPKTATTIPRMELTAAVTSAKLQLFLELEMDIKINKTIFWTDSTTVLAYINNTSKRFKPFVANRLSVIADSTIPSQWRYVPSNLNPADVASRGLHAKKLHSNCEWLIGPSFLCKHTDFWPLVNPNNLCMNVPNDEILVTKTNVIYTTVTENPLSSLFISH